MSKICSLKLIVGIVLLFPTIVFCQNYKKAQVEIKLPRKDKKDKYLYINYNFYDCNLHTDEYLSSLKQPDNTVFRVISYKQNEEFIKTYFKQSEYYQKGLIEVFDAGVFDKQGISFSNPCIFKFNKNKLSIKYGSVSHKENTSTLLMCYDSIPNYSRTPNPELRNSSGFITYYSEYSNTLFWKTPGSSRIDSLNLGFHVTRVLDNYYNENIKDSIAKREILNARQYIKKIGISEFYFMPYFFQLANGEQSAIIQLKIFSYKKDTIKTSNEVIFFKINLLNNSIQFKPFQFPSHLTNYYISHIFTTNSQEFGVTLAPKDKDYLILVDDTMVLCYSRFNVDKNSSNIEFKTPKAFINKRTYDQITNDGNTILMFFRLSDSLVVTPYSNSFFNIHNINNRDTIPFQCGPQDYSIWYTAVKGNKFYILLANRGIQSLKMVIAENNKISNIIDIPYDLTKYSITGISNDGKIHLAKIKSKYIYIYSYNSTN